MPLPTTLCSIPLVLAALAVASTTAAAMPVSPTYPDPGPAPIAWSETGSRTEAADSGTFEPAPGGLVGAPPARPARQAAESAENRRNLLRQHTLERALERLERQRIEPVYRYVPTPRPRHLGRATR